VLFEAGGFRVRLGGYVQGQFQTQEESEEQLSADGRGLLNGDRFSLRRGRLLLSAERDFAEMLLELDANTTRGVQLGVRQAEATLRYMGPNASAEVPLVALTLGLFRTPFGYETVRSARDRVWMENSLVAQAFFPGESDLGVRLRGGLSWFRYAFAVTNGHPLDEPRFGAQAPTRPSDFMGRVGFDITTGETRVSGGVSALVGNGFHPGTPATKDTLVVRDVTETGATTPQSIQLVPGRAATPSQTFGHWATGADFQLSARPLRAWRFSLQGEVYFGQNMDRGFAIADPVSTGFDVREFGAVLSYTQELFDWVLMGARLEYYNPNADSVARQGGRLVASPQDVLTASFLAGLQLPRSQTRLVVQYDAISDHLALGEDGLPRDLRNNRLFVRLQVGF
jgi:hypothetical protein